MIISATVIRKPRRNRRCGICREFIGPQPTLRLYGADETGDRPYPLWFHVTCANEWATRFESKISAAMAKYTAAVDGS